MSVGMYAQVPRVVAVAFLVVLVEPDQQPVLHLTKQQRPTAWHGLDYSTVLAVPVCFQSLAHFS